MSQLNSRQRDRLFNQVAARDGLNCYLCGKPWYGDRPLDEVRQIAKRDNLESPGFSSEDAELHWFAVCIPLVKKHLILEHKGNRQDHSLPNLGIAHQSCNVRKNPRRAGRVTKLLRGGPDLLSYYSHLRSQDGPVGGRFAEFIKAEKCKPMFKAEVERILFEEREAPLKALISAACNKSDLSKRTGTDYMEQLLNPYNGIYEIFEKPIPGSDPPKPETWVRKKQPRQSSEASGRPTVEQ